MKIVQILYSLDFGGAEIFCINLSNQLSKAHEVTLISLKDHSPDMIPLEKLDNKIAFVTLGLTRRWHPGNWMKMYNILKKINPDVIHTHLSSIVYAFLFSAIKKKPLFHTVHSLAYKDANPITLRLLRFIFNNFKHIEPVAISEEVLLTIKETYNSAFNTLIHNGVDVPIKTPEFHKVASEIDNRKFNKDTSVIINVASVKKIKNQLFLVDAVNELIAEGCNLIMINIGGVGKGEDGYYTKLMEIIGPGIYFDGLKGNVGDYLRCATLFCLTSAYEGLPLSLLEAMSLGVIPVCSYVGGIKEVINPDTGFGETFEYNDKEGFKAAVKKMIIKSKDELQQEQRKCIEAYKQHYAMDRCVAKYEMIFREGI